MAEAPVPPVEQKAEGRDNVQIANSPNATVNYYASVPAETVEAERLKAARALFDRLPVDALPEPSEVPAGSRMPHGRNPLFTGRAADLRFIAAALKGGGAAAAATGLGGLGKTQLAVEFVHRYGRYFAGVDWITMADAADVPAQVAQCAGAAGKDQDPAFANLKLDDQIRAVVAAWQGPLPRLLVFDNCESEALFAQWRPPIGGCRVLVTSRRAGWDRSLGLQARPLDTLSRAESLELLTKFRPDLSPAGPALDALAGELGDLPLALHLAGSYLERYRQIAAGQPAAYLAQLREQGVLDHPSLGGKWANLSPTGHERNLRRTFVLSYDGLDLKDPDDHHARARPPRARGQRQRHAPPGLSFSPVDGRLAVVEPVEPSVGRLDGRFLFLLLLAEQRHRA
jgi:hypothetical protein